MSGAQRPPRAALSSARGSGIAVATPRVAWLFRSVVAGFALMLAACAALSPNGAKEAQMQLPEIPYTKKVLENGLTVIVHEDHKTPIVNVTVWYHVGSKDEGPGRTGFAHLFEHLMFNGSEHYDNDYFRPLEEAGATSMNGTTGYDRTNYFQNVPANSLDLALWMESDRMGHLLGAIDQAKLEEQRSVVKNEKRQRESSPYGKVWEIISERAYPEGHPYSWTPIGSMEDLDAATLEDVRRWFEQYYGAANAVVVIAGDVDTETALAKVERYFGEIPPGPPVTHMERWVAPLEAPRRVLHEDRVAQGRIYRVWNIPPWGSEEALHLELAADVLGGGKTSRLYRRLVKEERLATGVAAAVDDKEIGSQVFVWVTARPGASLEEIEQVLDDELRRFRREGPTGKELERVRTARLGGFLRGIQHVGGFSGKGQVLAQSEVYGGNPDAWRTQWQTLLQASPDGVRAAAADWLGENALTVVVRPFGNPGSVVTDADRSALPAPAGEAPELSFPALERRTLDNGLTVVLARRSGTPLVEMNLLLPGGNAANPEHRPGLASMVAGMLDEGTESRSSDDIAESLERLGADLGASAGLDTMRVSLSALKTRLKPSLELFADVVRNPAFPADDLERVRQARLAAIAQEKTEPTSMALRLLPPLLYGEEHPYGQPFTGTGTEAAVAAMTRQELRAYHRRWVRPDEATLVVVADASLDEIVPQIKAVFGDWRVDGEASASPTVPRALPADRQTIYLVDRPGYEQSLIFAGQLASPTGSDSDIAMTAANTLFGGMFTSRLNMNLREDKGWAYGARSMLPDAKHQRPLLMYAPVERERTADAVREILDEMAGMRGREAIGAEELARAKKNLTLTLPGQLETAAELAGRVAHLQIYGLPDDYYAHFVSRVQALAPDAVQAAARELFQPEQTVWVIVGDIDEIKADIEALDIGPVKVIEQSAD